MVSVWFKTLASAVIVGIVVAAVVAGVGVWQYWNEPNAALAVVTAVLAGITALLGFELWEARRERLRRRPGPVTVSFGAPDWQIGKYEGGPMVEGLVIDLAAHGSFTPATVSTVRLRYNNSSYSPGMVEEQLQDESLGGNRSVVRGPQRGHVSVSTRGWVVFPIRLPEFGAENGWLGFGIGVWSKDVTDNRAWLIAETSAGEIEIEIAGPVLP